MLLDFTVGNFGPFRDDVTLSMEATRVTEHPGNVLDSGPSDADVLSSAIIFGSNAAGKSFVTEAVYVLTRIVRAVDEGIQPELYNPYRLSKECRESPVRMRIRLIIDDVLYDYRVEFREGEITSESLFHYPKGRRARVFDRTGPREFIGAKKRAVSMTTPSKTYLAMAAVGGDSICARVRDAIMGGFIFVLTDPIALIQSSCRFCDDRPERKDTIVRALGTADLGISNFTYDERQVRLADIRDDIPPKIYEQALRESDMLSTRDIFLTHDFDSPTVDDGSRTFPMDIESAGTRSMFGFVGPLIDALENGKVLVIDELGVHLHPTLTRWIVAQFSRGNNPNGAQLVANTHDVGLMDIAELLRRDQIWFVNKSRDDGASELYCLSEFEGVRKDTDVLRRYLDGRFDAVPAVRHRGVLRGVSNEKAAIPTATPPARNRPRSR